MYTAKVQQAFITKVVKMDHGVSKPGTATYTFHYAPVIYIYSPELVYLESNGFVRFGCKQQVLPLSVGWLNPLFIG